jgi:hypothetical protein
MNPRSVLDWLREGYPSGVPSKDYIPLIALLRRRLTEVEVREIAAEIAEQVPNGSTSEASTDIGVHITKLTDALPSDDELARVEKHLTQFHGWPE